MFTGRKRERKGEMRKKRVKKFFLKKHGNPPLLPFSSNFPSFPLSPTITPSFTATHGSFHIVSARQPPTLTVVLPDSLPHVVLPAAQESPLSLSLSSKPRVTNHQSSCVLSPMEKPPITATHLLLSMNWKMSTNIFSVKMWEGERVITNMSMLYRHAQGPSNKEKICAYSLRKRKKNPWLKRKEWGS